LVVRSEREREREKRRGYEIEEERWLSWLTRPPLLPCLGFATEERLRWLR
jgi:hypothetical protein